MRSPALAVLAALCALAAPAASPEPAASRILGAALTGSGGHEIVEHLCDRVGPRLSGSPALDLAIRDMSARLRTFRLDRVWTEPVSVPHWERGSFEAALTEPVFTPLVGLALGGSVPTAAEGVEGEVIEAASFEELTAKGDAVRGKIVLWNRRMVAGSSMDGYGAVSPLRSRGPSEAAKLGAVASLVRSLGTADFRLPHTGALRYADEVPRIPAAALAAEDAERIHRLLARGETVRVRLRMTSRTLPDASSANVLAELRGREKPEEIVVLAAHLDSWDVGCGAVDDGAGVAIVMETMRLLRTLDLRPRRTLRAVLFTNEENGLAGGKAYARDHAEELARHAAAIEVDSGAGRPLGASITAGPGAVEALQAILRPLAALEANAVESGGGGADISPMKAAGVPQIGLRQDTFHYFDWHHTEADTLDKVDPALLARNVAAFAILAYGLADAPEAPARIPEEQRKD
ncbi:MAG TPA: M20/M25/M40 family metallo-hydrolase [Candidatus Polarisedimenticolaceae bacterium]|nr:M20/M25/M40 family metallo-hydrolase [Candidatus Polarisedimenticolaceae bacterium]